MRSRSQQCFREVSDVYIQYSATFAVDFAIFNSTDNMKRDKKEEEG